jgi:hypothetical protein
VHSAKVPDQDGLKLLPDSARTAVSGLKHLSLDAGYEGRGRRWAEEVLNRSAKGYAESKPALWSQGYAAHYPTEHSPYKSPYPYAPGSSGRRVFTFPLLIHGASTVERRPDRERGGKSSPHQLCTCS